MRERDPRAIDRKIRHFLQHDPRVRALSVVRWQPFLAWCLADWALVLAAAGAAELSASGFAYLAACFVIAGRQHAFFVLTHEAAHYRILRSRAGNDLFADALFAFPILLDTEAYRRNHLRHHTHLNTDEDPDWARKVRLPQWQFPLSPGYVLRAFPRFALWNGPREWVTVMFALARGLPGRHNAGRLAYYALLAAALTLLGGWGLFAKYWVVPLLFVFPSLQRLRSAAEHFGLSREHDLNGSRNVAAPWLERIFLSPHNIHYHLDHHLIASVPFYNLPRLHALLREQDVFREHAHENTSYLLPSARPVTKDLLGEASATGAEEERRAA